MKRLFSTITLILLLTMILTACGSAKAAPESDVDKPTANDTAGTAKKSPDDANKDGESATDSGKANNETMKLVKGDGTSFEGTWETSYDLVVITLNGDKASGLYNNGTSTIEGTVKGNELIGTWVESEDDKGEFIFTLSEDAKSFTGKWRRPGDTEYKTWDGTRKVFD